MAATLVNAAIGTLTYFSIRGLSEPQKQQVDDVTRHNVPGRAIRRLALRGESNDYRAILELNAPTEVEIKAARDTQLALKGQIVTFTDDYGIEEDNMIIQDVRVPGRPRGNPWRVTTADGGELGGTATHVMELILVMVKKQ